MKSINKYTNDKKKCYKTSKRNLNINIYPEDLKKKKKCGRNQAKFRERDAIKKTGRTPHSRILGLGYPKSRKIRRSELKNQSVEVPESECLGSQRVGEEKKSKRVGK